MSQFQIGIDIGGTKTKGILVDSGGIRSTILFSSKPDQEFPNYCIDQLLDQAGITSNQLCGIGLGVAGAVRNGKVIDCPPLLWQDFPLEKMISKYHRTRIIVENDVNCSALAEWHFGNKPENLVNLAIGTGIGVGLILNGQIYRGQNGFAGEVGYWTTVEDIQSSLQHKIGSVGPLEKILSGTAIEGKHGSPKKFFPETEKNSKLISDFIDELVCVIANLISLLDPGLVVLGGGVSMSLNPWLSEINRKVNSTTPCQARIEISSLGENAVALGALQLLGP